MNSAQLLDTVTQMQNRVRSKQYDVKQFEQDFHEVKTSYPAVYSKASQPMSEQDMSVFRNMISKLSKIETNELSKHDASVEFGSTLVDTYVKPMLHKQ